MGIESLIPTSILDEENLAEKTLSEILQTLDQADHGLLQISPEKMPQILSVLLNKVDSIKYILDQLEIRAEYFRDAAKEFLDKAKAFDNRIDAMRAYFAETMIENNFEKIPGNLYQMSVQKRESLSNMRDPGPRDFLELGKFGLVKQSYVWDKKAVAEFLKTNKNEILEKSFETKTSHFITIGAKPAKEKKHVRESKQQSISGTTESTKRTSSVD
jgi:hypothetical protein